MSDPMPYGLPPEPVVPTEYVATFNIRPADVHRPALPQPATARDDFGNRDRRAEQAQHVARRWRRG